MKEINIGRKTLMKKLILDQASIVPSQQQNNTQERLVLNKFFNIFEFFL